MRCDRLFLIDAKYVEGLERYLFEGDVAYPGLGDRSLRDVVFRSGCVRPWKTSYSLMNGSHVCISYRDFFTLRGKLAHAYDVMMAVRIQNRTLLMLPFSRFPPLPVEVLGALPPQGLSVHLPRLALYSSNCAQCSPESVRIRYEVAFLLEWAYSVAAALTLEIETNAPVWKCSAECIDFLELFSSLDDFFVENVNRFVMSLAFRSLVGKLRRVQEFTATELTTRQDYPSSVNVAWAVIDPNDGSVVPPATSTRVTPRVSHRAPRVAPPVVTSSSPPSHSSLETVIPDTHIRTEPMWRPAFASEAVRVSGWRVRDLMDQLVARIGVVEAKGRDVAVELQDTKEQLVIANTKVTTLREEADLFRDRAPPRLLPRRQDSVRRVDRSDEYDDYDRADRGRDDYREDGRYYGGSLYAPQKLRRSEVYAGRDDPYGDDDRTDDYRSGPSR